MITIVDYGIGNLGSIVNMLKRTGAECRVASSVFDIDRADKLILPGVGAFNAAMERIEARGLRSVLDKKVVEERVPILGICLGMQMMTEGSEEGDAPGLGWIPARTYALRGRVPDELKVPHMGWNVANCGSGGALTEGLGECPRFYFVHSYFVHCNDRSHSVMTTLYGITYDSAFEKDNVYGVQFHPERSHRFGMKVLKNFADIRC